MLYVFLVIGLWFWLFVLGRHSHRLVLSLRSLICQLLVAGFVAKGRKRLKKRLSVDPNLNRTSMSSYFLKSIPAETCACLNNLAVNLSELLRKRFETVWNPMHFNETRKSRAVLGQNSLRITLVRVRQKSSQKHLKGNVCTSKLNPFDLPWTMMNNVSIHIPVH